MQNRPASRPSGRRPGPRTTAAALIGASLAVLFGAVLDRGEGNELVAYQDSIGKWTGCRGVIRNADGSPIRPHQRFTPAECASLNEAETVEHLLLALDAAPTLREGCTIDGGQACRWPGPLLAFGSLTYNIGGGNARSSTVARRFRAGDFYGGCVAFAMWDRAGGRPVRGLALRRAWEQSDLCFIGIPIPAGARVPAPSPDGRAWERQLRQLSAAQPAARAGPVR